MLIVYTTVAEEADAKRLAQTVIRAQLAACAQISRIESLYLWAGDLQQTPERRIAFKTTEACYDALATVLKADHPQGLLTRLLRVRTGRRGWPARRAAQRACRYAQAAQRSMPAPPTGSRRVAAKRAVRCVALARQGPTLPAQRALRTALLIRNASRRSRINRP